MQVPIKHHHLPVFYLARWVGEDKRLCQFSRPYKEVVPQRKHPEQTAFVERLYEMKGLPPEQAQQVEQRFMQRVDSLAAEALDALEQDDTRLTRDATLRSGWSRFLLSLLMRTPGDIATLKRELTAEWHRSVAEIEAKYAGTIDPATLAAELPRRNPDALEAWVVSLVPGFMDHRRIGEVLNNMQWFVRRISSDAGEFLTSDRPVVMTPLTQPGAFLFIPIGPKALFVAVNDIATRQRMEEERPAEYVERINRAIAGGAVKFVYARNDQPLEYVRQHMGTLRRETLFQRLARWRRERYAG